MAGKGWQIIEGDDFERGAAGCGGMRVVDEVIAPIKYTLSRNPMAYPLVFERGIRIARTRVVMRRSDIVPSYSVWFRANETDGIVMLMWVELTRPDDIDDWGDIPF